MATLTNQNLTDDGVEITTIAASATDTFENDGETIVQLENTDASSHDVTFVARRKCNMDFLHDRLDDISFAVCNSGGKIESIDDFFFDCKQVEVKENHCKWCGTELVEEKVKVPYGESHALKPEVYCPKCDTGTIAVQTKRIERCRPVNSLDYVCLHRLERCGLYRLRSERSS